jgi:hypothetical protein
MRASEASRDYPEGMYVVETQRTRGGTDRKTGADTRPYRFGEFDILAVNLHPSTGDWARFLFTLARWLVPRAGAPDLLAKFQPVPNGPDAGWTDDLNVALGWFLSRRHGRAFRRR